MPFSKIVGSRVKVFLAFIVKIKCVVVHALFEENSKWRLKVRSLSILMFNGVLKVRI